MGKRRKKNIRQAQELIRINRKKCIACTACAINCTKITNISVLKLSQPDMKVIKPKKDTFNDSGCIYCGQCTLICPTSAIDIREDINEIDNAIASNKYIVATFAPAVKATLGEEFGLEIGTNVNEKLATSARLLGANKVFQTDFGADMTVVEEAKELYDKINNKEALPMFTSCCPAWVKWAERFRRELLPNISTCKSPQQMVGTLIKTYFAEKNNIPKENIFVISIKPCTAKKFEAEKLEFSKNGYKDIDVVLTVREYAKLLNIKGINIKDIPSEEFDNLMGENTGSGAIFGSNTGVLRSTLRSVGYYFKDANLSNLINIKPVDLVGFDGVKVIEYSINNLTIKGAAVNVISNLINFLDSEKWKDYDFIEVMACPGGCINGGGTPKVMKKSKVKENFCVSCGTCIENCPTTALKFNTKGVAAVDKDKCVGCKLCSNLCRSNAISMEFYDKSNYTLLTESYIDLRKKVLNEIDEKSEIRVSNENPEVKEVYDNYLGEIGGSKALELLHTKFN
ncbi:hypothetical protein JCM1393_22630 [Clostridium carnis]